ncbi:hypothetical protein SAY87_031621 [Trapa incisa]|uniref:Major facilitator superfamily (MFS) profile domain-containing protein n=1 Tax=Trapa incisa TaxID=236973 RepID=A0AAN7KTP3_9MYRT|nr:hypothetical protein SAY87_031621 [Trapa incisa]
MALKVLSALDTAKTQYYHFKAIIVAGMGLFTDAYDLFCISPIMRLIGRIYYKDHKYEVAVALLGTAIGQIVFGYLGDRVGRRRVYGISLTLMVLSSLGCGFSICTSRGCVLGSLGFFRFLLGLGIGGDYPLSATIMSEFANKATRGAFIAAVFSMQGFGILASSVVTMAICGALDGVSKARPEDETPIAADIAWRVLLMLGAVPAAATFYWRMMMPETARYTALVEHNVLRAAMDMEKVLDVSLRQIEEEHPLPPATPPPTYPLLSGEFFHRHGRDLLSCASTWFLLDVVFYSSNLFQSHIYSHFIPDKSHVNAFKDAFDIAKLQAVVAACSTIPGYWATVYFIDRVGRVKIQIMGFLFMAAGFFAMGAPYYNHWDRHTDYGFMVLYGLTFFFANFGPNTTTFIVPAELFPARFRTTCNGLSGASGKLGALVGSVGFLWASHRKKENDFPKAIGMTASLMILGGICIVGAAITYLFTTETTARSLEENEKDDGFERDPLEAVALQEP